MTAVRIRDAAAALVVKLRLHIRQKAPYGVGIDTLKEELKGSNLDGDLNRIIPISSETSRAETRLEIVSRCLK